MNIQLLYFKVSLMRIRYGAVMVAHTHSKVLLWCVPNISETGAHRMHTRRVTTIDGTIGPPA